jgi:hypothetical protein
MREWVNMGVIRSAAVLAVVTVVATGCSFVLGDTPDGVAVELIEGELAEEAGLGEVTATCEEPPNSDPGTTFECTSNSDYGEIRWSAEMIDEETVNVTSVNFLSVADVVTLEESAVVALEGQYGISIGTENFDCGEEPIVLGDDLTVLCAATDPITGDVHDAEITFIDLQTGNFDVVVAEQPRR